MANLKLGIPYVQKWEGGLSDAKTDKASKNPSPYVYNGKSGWHTNKGVTWTAFKSLATVLGYAVNATNFLTMPAEIWEKIFIKSYADSMKAQFSKSDAIGIALSDFAWASGGARKEIYRWLLSQYKVNIFKNGSYDMKQAVDFINTLPEEQTFLKIVNIRRDYFRSLNQPANIKGWLNRMNDLEKFGLELIKKKKQTI